MQYIDYIFNIIDTLSHIGRTNEGGSNRLGFTANDITARKYIISLIESEGLAVRVDGFGNIIARYDSGAVNKPAVATGSHIDTVPNGGHFDGMLGVATGLTAIKAIKDSGMRLSHPLELIIFQLEESSRFGHATMGSKFMAGIADIDKFLKAEDNNGVTLKDVLTEHGFDTDKLHLVKREKDEIKSFIEVHIDQCRDLEKENKSIGIVETIAAPTRFKVVIKGVAAHSGATIIADRKDALVVASELVLSVRNLALAYAEKNIISTVGNLRVHSGAMNVVPGLVDLFIDIRGTDKDVKSEVAELINEECSRLSQRHGVDINIEKLTDEEPVKMSKAISSLLLKLSNKIGIPSDIVISRAGQDSMNMASLTETSMIFVRTKDGISHQPKEEASRNDINDAFLLLKEALLELAK